MDIVFKEIPHGTTHPEFKNNQAFQAISYRAGIIIGNALKDCSENLKTQYSEDISWRKFIRFRDKIAHLSGNANEKILCIAVQEDFPLLQSQILPIIQKISQ